MRAGMALVVAVYTVYSLFGVAAPFLWGHHGYHGATYMLRAVMSLRFHILLPATWAGYDFPPRFAWYLHHPIGYHHILTPLVAIFGAHEWVARGAAFTTGYLTIAALYVLVRRWWSREAALLANAAWVTLPIVCSFSILSDAIFPTLACFLVALDAWLRYREEPRARLIALASVMAVAGGLLMWEQYFLALACGVWAMARLATARGRAQRVEIFGRSWNAGFAWTLLTGLASSSAMAFHVLYARHLHMIEDMRGSYAVRSNASFAFALGKHTLWFDLLYGTPVIAVGLLWLCVFVARAAAGRARVRDAAVLAFFLMNTLYNFLFAEASAVHEYRDFFYAVFFVLALADLATDLWSGVHALAARSPSLAPRLAWAAVALLLAGYFALDLPHAWHNLIESREIMGTHGQPGYNAEYSKQLFAMEVARRTGKEDFVFVHPSLPRRIEFYFYMDRSNLDIQTLAQLPSLQKEHPRALVLMDLFPSEPERKLMLELLKEHPGYSFDHYLLIDLRSKKAEFREYQYQPQPMSRAYRFFVSHKYPPMKAVETASLATACVYANTLLAPPADGKVPAAPSPSNYPLSECFHNFEALRGDGPAAAAFRDKIGATLTRQDATLGEFASVLGYSPRAGGLDLWLALDRVDKLPADARIEWTMTPIAGPDDKAPPTVPAPPVTRRGGTFALAPRRVGLARYEKLAWALPPGRYRLALDVVASPPPAARLPAGRKTVPSAPVTLATATLGPIEIR